MCRLAAVHRVTQDVDTVTETTAPTAVEVIASSIGAPDPSDPNRVVVDGITIDVIDTEPFTDTDLVGLDIEDRRFIVSHRWALETATPIVLVAGGETASIRVATPPALVAMKSGAVAGGRRRDAGKQASDLYDLYRLTAVHDRAGGIAMALAAAPFALGPLVAESIHRRVLDEPERAVRALLRGGPEMRSITAEDLRAVFGPLVERLEA
jgi:hypothetical protein